VSRGSKAFLVVLVLLAVGVGAGMSWLSGGTGDSDFVEGEPVVFEVPEGVGARQVAVLLEEEGVIRSGFAFRLSARDDERASKIRPGVYELRRGMSADEILEILSDAPPAAETFRVTIPEGLTVDQTLDRLAAAGPYDEEELRAALEQVALPAWVPELPEEADPFEGLLFPDTYEFTVETAAADVLARLLEQTENILDQVDLPDGFSRYEVLIMASLIERETKVREEQALVSSVIHNRLSRPMRLQIDATVQYARGEHTDRVLFRDLEIASLWNTYQHDGLPPTPISGSGRAAILAAAEPAETDYLFYVVSDLETGEHAFATSAEEHNRNVAEYRRKRDEAQARAEAGELEPEELETEIFDPEPVDPAEG
jgi:UPF0755 protein